MFQLKKQTTVICVVNSYISVSIPLGEKNKDNFPNN